MTISWSFIDSLSFLLPWKYSNHSLILSPQLPWQSLNHPLVLSLFISHFNITIIDWFCLFSSHDTCFSLLTSHGSFFNSLFLAPMILFQLLIASLSSTPDHWSILTFQLPCLFCSYGFSCFFLVFSAHMAFHFFLCLFSSHVFLCHFVSFQLPCFFISFDVFPAPMSWCRSPPGTLTNLGIPGAAATTTAPTTGSGNAEKNKR